MSTGTKATAEWYGGDAETRPERPWKPAVGDRIVGRVTDIDRRQVSWKEVSKVVPVLLLDTGDEEYVDTVWALHTVLMSELAKHRPKVGEEVAIARLEDSEAGGYKRYKVWVNRDGPREFDWDSVDPLAAGDVDPQQMYGKRPAKPETSYADAAPFPDDEPMPWERKEGDQ